MLVSIILALIPVSHGASFHTSSVTFLCRILSSPKSCCVKLSLEKPVHPSYHLVVIEFPTHTFVFMRNGCKYQNSTGRSVLWQHCKCDLVEPCLIQSHYTEVMVPMYIRIPQLVRNINIWALRDTLQWKYPVVTFMKVLLRNHYLLEECLSRVG